MEFCVVSSFCCYPRLYNNKIVNHYARTDPAKMNIYLVNQHVYPNTQKLIASNVDTDSGSYTINAKDVDVDTGYVDPARRSSLSLSPLTFNLAAATRSTLSRRRAGAFWPSRSSSK